MEECRTRVYSAPSKEKGNRVSSWSFQFIHTFEAPGERRTDWYIHREKYWKLRILSPNLRSLFSNCIAPNVFIFATATIRSFCCGRSPHRCPPPSTRPDSRRGPALISLRLTHCPRRLVRRSGTRSASNRSFLTAGRLFVHDAEGFAL